MFLWNSCVCNAFVSASMCILSAFSLALLLVCLFCPILLWFGFCLTEFYDSSLILICFLRRDRKGERVGGEMASNWEALREGKS